MCTEITQVVERRELPSRLRDQNLPAVAGGRDSRRTMDVYPDVALVRDQRFAGVQAHTHLDRTARQRLAPVGGRSERVRRLRERHEEGVTLRVHLDPPVTGEYLP